MKQNTCYDYSHWFSAEKIVPNLTYKHALQGIAGLTIMKFDKPSNKCRYHAFLIIKFP